MSDSALVVRRWTRTEYDRLVGLGAFEGDPIALRAVLPRGWIVNLAERALEVHRDPQPDPSAPYGWRYRSVATLTAPASLTPLAFAGARLAVADLLP